MTRAVNTCSHESPSLHTSLAIDEIIGYKNIQFIPCALTFLASIKSHKLTPQNVQFAKFFK